MYETLRTIHLIAVIPCMVMGITKSLREINFPLEESQKYLPPIQPIGLGI
jgi:hypothetical protein